MQDSPSIMLQGMAGSRLGVWVAHGEGRCLFPDGAIASKVLDEQLAPVRYIDRAGGVTEQYPCNPNGSPHGIAALCSPDGRHLAMMPHPERCAAQQACLCVAFCLWNVRLIRPRSSSIRCWTAGHCAGHDGGHTVLLHRCIKVQAVAFGWHMIQLFKLQCRSATASI